jgi:hypothetical protein
MNWYRRKKETCSRERGHARRRKRIEGENRYMRLEIDLTLP